MNFKTLSIRIDFFVTQWCLASSNDVECHGFSRYWVSGLIVIISVCFKNVICGLTIREGKKGGRKAGKQGGNSRGEPWAGILSPSSTVSDLNVRALRTVHTWCAPV